MHWVIPIKRPPAATSQGTTRVSRRPTSGSTRRRAATHRIASWCQIAVRSLSGGPHHEKRVVVIHVSEHERAAVIEDERNLNTADDALRLESLHETTAKVVLRSDVDQPIGVAKLWCIRCLVETALAPPEDDAGVDGQSVP